MISIPANPFNFTIDPTKVALIVIDMQRDFIEPGGFGETLGNNVSLLRPSIAVVARLLAAFRERGMMIVHTIEGHQPDLSDCPASKRMRGSPGLRIGDQGTMGRILILGQPGNGIVSELAPMPGEVVIEKPGKGAFYATPLGKVLAEKGITHLVFSGVTTEVCVQTTMREANDRGYECLLIEDASDSYFPQFKRATIEMIRAQGGIVGCTTTSDRLLSVLQADTSMPLEAAPNLPVLVQHLLGPVGNLDGLTWQPFAPGIEIYRLYGNQQVGPSAAILRYQPGASVAFHRHQGYEHVLVLRGSQSDERGSYTAGTLVINPPGSGHSIHSAEGCIVLLIWEKPVVFEKKPM